MPDYAWLLNRRLSSTPSRSGCGACGCWECPTRTSEIADGIAAAHKQADEIVAKLTESDAAEKEQ